MTPLIVYGKIIIDDIVDNLGGLTEGVLGGGGPQAAWGARLWYSNVHFFSRAGEDLEPKFRSQLAELEVSLDGLTYYSGMTTPRNALMQYDADGRSLDDARTLGLSGGSWAHLDALPQHIPEDFERASAVHLLLGTADDPILDSARALRKRGALVSLEPLMDVQTWSNADAVMSIVGDADVVCPDWPTAVKMAGTDDVKGVMSFWTGVGPSVVAVRAGSRGSYLCSNDQDGIWHVPPLSVSVVDQTGAGNAYSASFCAGLAAGADAITSACMGTVAASIIIEEVGTPPQSDSLRSRGRERLVRLAQRPLRVS